MIDLDRRMPVWVALSSLFVDTDIDDEQHRQIAQVLKHSGYPTGELREIYEHEVAPVCYTNLYSTQGTWEGIDPQLLSAAIVAHRTRRAQRPGWWPFGRMPQKLGVQMTRPDWNAVARMLRRLRRDPSRLAETLANSSDVATMVRALDDLALLGRSARSSPNNSLGSPMTRACLEQALGHRDYRVRAAAVEAAASLMGDRAAGAVLARLADGNSTVASAAIAAVHDIVDEVVAPHPDGANGSLRPTWSDHLLGRIAERWLEEICRHLRRGKSHDRLHAARVVESLGPHAAEAADTLLERFGDRNEAVRRAIADALVAIEPDPKTTLDKLRYALFEQSPRVRQTASLCLGMFLAGGDQRYHPAMAALEQALGDQAAPVQRGAASAIGWMGPPAASAVPRLADLARAPEAPTRSSALFALGRMKQAALAELPTLAAALHDDHPEVRRAALRAFQELGPVVRPMAPQFKRMLADPDWLTQFEAKRTLDAVTLPTPPEQTG